MTTMVLFSKPQRGVFAGHCAETMSQGEQSRAQYFGTYNSTVLFRFLFRWVRGKLGLTGPVQVSIPILWQGKIRLLRETALKKIHGCAKKHGQDVAINLEVQLVESFLHQIKNKMILVAIVGEGSCGKSTLVNALLRNRYTYIAASKEFIIWLCG